MSWLARFRIKQNLERLFDTYFNEDQAWKKYSGNVTLLVKVVDAIRPRKFKQENSVSLQPLLTILKDEAALSAFRNYLFTIFKHKRFYSILTDADIIKDASFFHELKQRIVAKFIPNQPDEDSLEYLLAQVFFLESDVEWVGSIAEDERKQLYTLLIHGEKLNSKSELFPRTQLVFAIEVLGNRMAGVATESEVNKMVPEYASYENPFLNMQRELHQFLDKFRNDITLAIDENNIDYRQILVLHGQCEEFVNQAYKNIAKYGISIRVNQYFLRINQQLKRLKELLEILIEEEREDSKNLNLFLYLIRVNYQKNNVSELLDKGTQRVAFEITQQKAKSGEHYITKDKREYSEMLRASIGGGAIVGVLCITKLLSSKLDVSPFGEAIIYSLNYAIGFIVIYLLGYTLATKQPAMTASSFVKSLEEGKNKKKDKNRYFKFAILFTRLFRSQFIAFVGNVFMAFPVALIGVLLIDFIADYNIAAQKGQILLEDINPTTSKALLHASIAGIYLFVSGVIAGNVGNRIKHNKISFRIAQHPILKTIFGQKFTNKLSQVHAKKYPGVMSNLWFGIFMGSTASLGYFMGLDLDIRHITFASGNFALGMYGTGWHISLDMFLWCILGIGLIGLLNFIVSFALSILVAMRSCGIAFLELRFIITAIFAHIMNSPLSFFYPTDNALELEKQALEEL